MAKPKVTSWAIERCSGDGWEKTLADLAENGSAAKAIARVRLASFVAYFGIPSYRPIRVIQDYIKLAVIDIATSCTVQLRVNYFCDGG